MAGGDLLGDQTHLREVLRKLCRCPVGQVPFDLWHFGFNEDTQRHLLGGRFSQLVGGELIGQNDLVLLERLSGGLEVDDCPLAAEVGHQVDDADKGQIEIADPQFEDLFDGRDLAETR